MPLYYTDGNEGLFSRITETFDQLERDLGVTWTPYARVLVFNSLTAMQEDPSPTWLAGREARLARTTEMIARLPDLVRQVSRNESVEGRVTYFQVLHWLTDHLDGVCPFEKRPVAEEDRHGEFA